HPPPQDHKRAPPVRGGKRPRGAATPTSTATQPPGGRPPPPKPAHRRRPTRARVIPPATAPPHAAPAPPTRATPTSSADTGARALHAGGHGRVVLRAEVLPRGHPNRGSQATDVDGLLQRHRQAAKRRVITACPPRVGGLGLAARALEVGLDDGIQLGVVALD